MQRLAALFRAAPPGVTELELHTREGDVIALYLPLPRLEPPPRYDDVYWEALRLIQEIDEV